MTAEIIFRKRPGHEGEMGLFLETEVFAEEFAALKIGAEVKAVCTVPAHARYNKFFHALVGKVADNCDWLLDRADAKERILLEARHYKTIHDPLRGKTEIKAKSVGGLSGEDWIKLLRRVTFVVTTKFLPGMDENALRAEIEAMLGPDTTPGPPAPAKPPKAARAKKASTAPALAEDAPIQQPEEVPTEPPAHYAAHDGTGTAVSPPSEPVNEEQYLAFARQWITEQTDHRTALEFYESAEQIALRAACRLSIGANKAIRRELAMKFEP